MIMAEELLCQALAFCVNVCSSTSVERHCHHGMTRVETSKTLFYYLKTVTYRDAPIQIKYHHWINSLQMANIYISRYIDMACGKKVQTNV